MNIHYLYVLWLLCSIVPMCKGLVKEDIFACSLPISRFTYQVHRRFYFIERLKKTMRMLATINDRIDQFNFLVRSIIKEKYVMNCSFSHARIQTSVEEIIKTKSLKPLFMVWDDFTIYKSLDDDLFVEEFTKEIFIVTKGLLSSYVYESPTFKNALKQLTIDPSYDTIHDIVEMIAGMTDMFEHGLQLRLDIYRDGLVDVISEVTSEDVLLRFYHTQRVRAYEDMIAFFEKNPLYCFKATVHNKDDSLIFEDEFEFSSPVVRRVIRKMEQTADIVPLLMLLEDLKQFKYIDNSPFAKEVLIALFCAQKNYLLNMTSADQSAKNINTLETLVNAYNTIEELPIEEILDVMDAAVHLFKELSQKQENGLQWRDIIAGGWVVRIASLVMMTAKIIGHYVTS